MDVSTTLVSDQFSDVLGQRRGIAHTGVADPRAAAEAAAATAQAIQEVRCANAATQCSYYAPARNILEAERDCRRFLLITTDGDANYHLSLHSTAADMQDGLLAELAADPPWNSVEGIDLDRNEPYRLALTATAVRRLAVGERAVTRLGRLAAQDYRIGMSQKSELEALLAEATPCKRYLLVTANRSGGEHFFCWRDTPAELAESVVSQLCEEVPWHAVSGVDLDTGDRFYFPLTATAVKQDREPYHSRR